MIQAVRDSSGVWHAARVEWRQLHPMALHVRTKCGEVVGIPHGLKTLPAPTCPRCKALLEEKP